MFYRSYRIIRQKFLNKVKEKIKGVALFWGNSNKRARRRRKSKKLQRSSRRENRNRLGFFVLFWGSELVQAVGSDRSFDDWTLGRVDRALILFITVVSSFRLRGGEEEVMMISLQSGAGVSRAPFISDRAEDAFAVKAEPSSALSLQPFKGHDSHEGIFSSFCICNI